MLSAKDLFETGFDLIWVVWGEQFTREALASARLAMAAHRSMHRIRYRIITYGDVNSTAARLLYMASEDGIEHIARKAHRPLNGTWMDLWKMQELARSTRPTFYCDSDLIFFDTLFRAAPFDDFDCMNYVQAICHDCDRLASGPVNEVVGKWFIDGAKIVSDYRLAPRCRMCTGLLFTKNGASVSRWIDAYEKTTLKVSRIYSRWMAELLISGMHAAGIVKCALRNRSGIQVPMHRPANWHGKIITEVDRGSIVSVRHMDGHAVGHAWHIGKNGRLVFSVDDDGHVICTSPNAHTTLLTTPTRRQHDLIPPRIV